MDERAMEQKNMDKDAMQFASRSFATTTDNRSTEKKQ